MKEFLIYGGMSVAVISAVAGQIALGQAKEHVKVNWPRLFEKFSDYGLPVLKSMSSADNKVRRALAKNMLIGMLPAEVKADPRMAELTQRWRLALAGIAVGFTAMIVAVR